jgi:GNAT superfamily N-acetyltransferase
LIKRSPKLPRKVFPMIRQANNVDLDEVSRLARIVTSNLHSLGIDQWSELYPLRVHFEADLMKQGLYVFEENNVIVGAMALLPEQDPPYLTIPFSKGRSYVIHRIMVLPHRMRQKIGISLFEYAIDYCKDQRIEFLKIDTHPDNFRMRQFLQKMGFQEIGYMPSIHRIGYQLDL